VDLKQSDVDLRPTKINLRYVALPIGWTVNFARNELTDCHRWIVPKPIQDIPVYDASAGDEGLWALKEGGVDVNTATYTVTVQGLTDAAVVIRDLRVKILSQDPATHGTTIENGDGCGGQITVRPYVVDLTESNPELMTPTETGTLTPQEDVYTVSKSDPEVFQLEAELGNHPGATPYTYSFIYQFDWSQGAASGTVEIRGPDGKPFRLTPFDTGPPYLAMDGVWENRGH
jgi:hypothetical protein